MSLLIVVSSVALSYYDIINTYYKEVVLHTNGKSEEAGFCVMVPFDMHDDLIKSYIFLVCKFVLEIVIPMVIILVTQVIMYIKLRQQAKRMSRSTTQDQTQRLQKLSKTFITVVIAFYICVFPHYFQHMYENYLIVYDFTHYAHIVIRDRQIHEFFTITTYINCTLNPFIYSKIHERIFVACKWLWKKIKKIKPTILDTEQPPQEIQQWPVGSFKNLPRVKVAIFEGNNKCKSDVGLPNINSNDSHKEDEAEEIDVENPEINQRGGIDVECGKVNASYERFENSLIVLR